MQKKEKQLKSSVFNKSLLATGLLFVLIVVVYSIIFGVVFGEYDDNDKADYVNWCNRYYYAKEYGSLLEELQLFNLYDEEFDIYWEITDGYRDYIEYEQWSSVTDEELPGSSQKAEEYRQKVIDDVKNCEFEANRERLQEFVDKIR